MKKTVKTFACSALLLTAAATANAELVGYSISNPMAGNIYGAVPMTSASGSFVYDTVADTLTGNIAYTWDYAIQNIDMAYSADWAVDFGTGNLVATNVSCTDTDPAGADGCADPTAPPAGFNGVMSLDSGDLSIATIGNVATMRQFTNGVPGGGYYTFDLTSTGTAAPPMPPIPPTPGAPNSIPATPFYSLALTILGLSWVGTRRLRNKRSKK